jgi:hypothetical protein
MKKLHLPTGTDPRKPHILMCGGTWMVYIFSGFEAIWLDMAKEFTRRKNNPHKVKQLDLRYNERRHG